MTNIAVIGSGTMGNGIAHVFAQYGFSVTLIDISEEALKKATTTIDKNMGRQVEKGLLTEEAKKKALANLTTTTFLKEGVCEADLVVEAATENLDLKLKIFKEVDESTKPGTILASNTSSISITKIASVTKSPDLVIGMHFPGQGQRSRTNRSAPAKSSIVVRQSTSSAPSHNVSVWV